MVVEAVESTDPAVCTTLITTGYLEEITDKRGDEAVRACEEELKAANARNSDTELLKTTVADSTATVLVTYQSDGRSLKARMRLTKDGDEWKIFEVIGLGGGTR